MSRFECEDYIVDIEPNAENEEEYLYVTIHDTTNGETYEGILALIDITDVKRGNRIDD